MRRPPAGGIAGWRAVSEGSCSRLLLRHSDCQPFACCACRALCMLSQHNQLPPLCPPCPSPPPGKRVARSIFPPAGSLDRPGLSQLKKISPDRAEAALLNALADVCVHLRFLKDDSCPCHPFPSFSLPSTLEANPH